MGAACASRALGVPHDVARGADRRPDLHPAARRPPLAENKRLFSHTRERALQCFPPSEAAVICLPRGAVWAQHGEVTSRRHTAAHAHRDTARVCRLHPVCTWLLPGVCSSRSNCPCRPYKRAVTVRDTQIRGHKTPTKGADQSRQRGGGRAVRQVRDSCDTGTRSDTLRASPRPSPAVSQAQLLRGLVLT